MTITTRLAPTAAQATNGDELPGGLAPHRGVVLDVTEDGMIRVDIGRGIARHCEVLQSPAGEPYQTGDRVLAALPRDATGLGVVLGRIGPYVPPQPASELRLVAAEALSLRCGEASIDLRADGKVMIRGEDVLVRAKGTQRIRAGTVAIN